MDKKISIKDIARMAGVSTTAVSFALNGRSGISPTTRKKILEVVKETQFHPGIASRRLASQKSYNVAIIYPSAASPFVDMFYVAVVQGITKELTRNGYNAVMVSVEEGADVYQTPTILQRKDADGVILLYTMPHSLLAEIRDYELPYVLVDWQDESTEEKSVLVDSNQSILLAMQYLLQKGHRDIGFFGSSLYPKYYLRCFNSYQRIFTNQQLSVYPNWIQSEVHNAESAMQCLKSAWSCQRKPTAICCTSDMCAIYTIQAASRMKIDVPEELSIISVDDIPMSQFIYPPLTTVSFDKEEIGKKSAELLLKMLNGEESESICIRDQKIVERFSVLDLT